MRILFCGDVVGRSGREAVQRYVPLLRQRLNLDCVIVNGENAASGFGITSSICQDFYKIGVDVITTGNHIWDQREMMGSIDKDKRLLRPINYPATTPGQGYYLHTTAKNGPCILACKHQSVWETLVVSSFLKDFTIVLKKELKNIPLYGLFLKNLDMIFIDRQARSQAVKNLIIQGRQAFKAKKSIIIFPEGTRSIPGTVTTYHPGIALLYQDLKIPVVPIALNSGLFWGRRSMVKKSGLITLQFLPPIQPGLDRNEFMNRLQDNLETACQKLNESVQKTD